MKKIRADNNFRKRARRDNKSAFALFLSNDGTAGDIIPGYKPLDKNEDIVKCANRIADLVSSMTIMLMENGENGDRRIRSDLSKKIDVYPCSYMDRKNFIFKIAKDMLLGGNSVVYPETDGRHIWNLVPLERRSCSFHKEDDGYYILYKGQRLEADDVLHFSYIPDENEPFKGVGYKDAIIDTVSTLVQANATKKKFLSSKWKPNLIISIQADAEELQDEEMRKKILGSYISNTEEGEPWVIPAGEIDVKTVQPLTLNDLAIQDSITLDKRAIASAFNMPPFMLGIGDFNKDAYNNFISTTVMSLAMVIQQQLTRKLLLSGSMYFKMNYKSLIQYNLSETQEFVKTMVGGGMMSRNEGRAEFDYAPSDAPGMNDYIVLENYIPVEKVGEQKKLKDGEKNG